MFPTKALHRLYLVTILKTFFFWYKIKKKKEKFILLKSPKKYFFKPPFPHEKYFSFQLVGGVAKCSVTSHHPQIPIRLPRDAKNWLHRPWLERGYHLPPSEWHSLPRASLLCPSFTKNQRPLFLFHTHTHTQQKQQETCQQPHPPPQSASQTEPP